MNSDLKIEDGVTSKIFNDSKLELTFCLNFKVKYMYIWYYNLS